MNIQKGVSQAHAADPYKYIDLAEKKLIKMVNRGCRSGPKGSVGGPLLRDTTRCRASQKSHGVDLTKDNGSGPVCAYGKAYYIQKLDIPWPITWGQQYPPNGCLCGIMGIRFIRKIYVLV